MFDCKSDFFNRVTNSITTEISFVIRTSLELQRFNWDCKISSFSFDSELITLYVMLNNPTTWLLQDVITKFQDWQSPHRFRSWYRVEDPNFHYISENRAPSTVKFFAWLLSKGRVQSMDVLLKKHVLNPRGEYIMFDLVHRKLCW